MIKLFGLEIRGQDAQGAGYFGAPRRSRKHRGVDLCCEAGSVVSSETYGEVTKVGYPYRMDDEVKGHLRYVEVTLDGNRFRYFYVEPLVSVGDMVAPGNPIGISQDLTGIYSGITQHFHFEIIKPDGSYQDPSTMFGESEREFA